MLVGLMHLGVVVAGVTKAIIQPVRELHLTWLVCRSGQVGD